MRPYTNSRTLAYPFRDTPGSFRRFYIANYTHVSNMASINNFEIYFKLPSIVIVKQNSKLVHIVTYIAPELSRSSTKRANSAIPENRQLYPRTAHNAVFVLFFHSSRLPFFYPVTKQAYIKSIVAGAFS